MGIVLGMLYWLRINNEVFIKVYTILWNLCEMENKMIATLIKTLIQQTIDFHRYLDDYQIDINEELVLTAIKYKQQLINELNELTFKQYNYVIKLVVNNAEAEIYGNDD